MEFRGLAFGEPRPPTWAERDRLALLRDEGIEDVYLPPEDAPAEFWRALILATEHFLLRFDRLYQGWIDWDREFRWATGLSASYTNHAETYRDIVETGYRYIAHGRVEPVTFGQRLAAVEHLLDVLDDWAAQRGFCRAINEKCEWLRLGLRLEGQRFVPVQSAHLHQEVVQPTLLLLADAELAGVDALYRKAFDRVLSNDRAGAITAATSAIEELLRIRLGVAGGQLQGLLQQARSAGLVIPAVEQLAVKMQALRQESDAHAPGTEDRRVAMLAIHVAGALILHLAAEPDD